MLQFCVRKIIYYLGLSAGERNGYIRRRQAVVSSDSVHTHKSRVRVVGLVCMA